MNAARPKIVFLLDVDNTLLDNDAIIADLRRYLEAEVGSGIAGDYWNHFERLRNEIGYADYLGALQRFRTEHPHACGVLAVSQFLIEYPFGTRVFPHALDVVREMTAFGPCVLLTDGDVVFQPRKVKRSGLGEAVGERVLIYVHKERELSDVERLYPADHYVLVDDKLRILAAVKSLWNERVTTVFVRQGHYAKDPNILATYPPADVSVDQIGDLLDDRQGSSIASIVQQQTSARLS